MAEELASLRQKGGGSGTPTAEEYTDNINFSDTTTYHNIGTGYLCKCVITRGGVSVAPVLEFYTKDAGGTYTSLGSITTASGTVTFYPSQYRYGAIYVRRTGGSTFTTTVFKATYIQ